MGIYLTRNRRMCERLNAGECKDVTPFGHVVGGVGIYTLPHGFFEEGKDYCDAQTEMWIWSIGRNYADGRIVASTDNRFYQNPDWECLWLR